MYTTIHTYVRTCNETHPDDVSDDLSDLRPDLAVGVLFVGGGFHCFLFGLFAGEGRGPWAALPPWHPALAEVVGLRVDALEPDQQ